MSEELRSYNTYIPVSIPSWMLDTWGESYAQLAKDMNAELFIIVRNVFGDKDAFIKNIEDLKKKVDFFKARGLSVGAWVCPTTGHEGMGLTIGEEGKKFTG